MSAGPSTSGALPKPLAFLEDLQAERPDLAEDIAELATFYQRKLWHQLTVRLEAAFASAPFSTGDLPVRIFKSFVLDFFHKINLLKAAHFAVHAAKFLPGSDSAASADFLATFIVKLEEAKMSAQAAQPILFLKAHVAQARLEAGAVAEAKAAVEDIKATLANSSEVDPSVSASVWYVASLYYKTVGEYADFYRSALTYLSFVSSDTLPADFKLQLAVDVSLAALLGEHVFSFGQLLQHPVVLALDGTPYAWLHELLRVFNAGDLHGYDAACITHATALNAQPALLTHERRLREKITVMCLLELVAQRPADDRTILLADIGAATKLAIDGVEFLLMKALALHLIEGTIDQVAGTVSVSWVQPRILTRDQVQGLKDRLDGWITQVAAVSLTLEKESVGVVEAAH